MLPEPLFTSVYHDTFIKCYQLENIQEATHAVLMLCLLLPGEHLSTLRFVLICWQKMFLIVHILVILRGVFLLLFF